MVKNLLYSCAIFILSVWHSHAHAQGNGTVKGSVTDEDGQSLIGVAVVTEGASFGTVTDMDGNYSLSLPAGNYTLRYNYMGFASQKRSASVKSGQTLSLNVKLGEEAQQFKEVVAVGYGTRLKRDLVGSVAKIDGVESNLQVGTSFEAQLQGRAPGVLVTQSSGIAGAGSIVRIRGTASISAGGDPLYVVDGIPITQGYFISGNRGGQNNNPLSSINPNDIESIEVLKDASATAIYGSRGANGVIIITTKKGSDGKPRFNFNSRVGISQPTKKLDFLNGSEWLQLYQEAYENDGGVGRAQLPDGLTWEEAEGVNTNWVDEMIRTGIKHDYNLSMNAGWKKIKTYAGLSYANAQSYLIGNSFERLSFRGNIDYELNSKIKLTLNTSLARGTNRKVDQAWSGGLGAAQTTALPIYKLDRFENSGFGNPLKQIELIDWRGIENRSINNFNISYKATDKLSFNARTSLDYMNFSDNIFRKAAWDRTNNIPSANRYRNTILNFSTYLTGDYDWKINESHKLHFQLGTEYQSSENMFNEVFMNYVNDQIFRNPGQNSDDTSAVFQKIENERLSDYWLFLSQFGRIDYNYKNKFLVNLTMRRDGSSKFGDNKKFALFPAAGVGYVMSDEAWFKESRANFINYLKWKTSIGRSGNADIDWNQQFGLAVVEGDAGRRYNDQQIRYITQPNNPDLTWETVTIFDAGFELGVLRNRITSEFAFYNRQSNSVIINQLPSSSSGITRYYGNIADVRNRGVELLVNANILVRKFKWSVNFNMARNRNMVTDIGTIPDGVISGEYGDTRIVRDQPIGVNYLVPFSHIDPQTGNPVFRDLEGNLTQNFSLDYRQPAGNIQPDFMGGITNNFSYGNWEMSMLWTFVVGGKIYDDAAKRQLTAFNRWNMRRDIIDRWTEEGDDATYARLSLNPESYPGLDAEYNYNHTQWLYDASYLRFKNLNLVYHWPLKEKRYFSRLDITFNATNLMTFTKFPGWDPEIVRDHEGPQGRNVGTNITYLTPPQERSYVLGVNLNF